MAAETHSGSPRQRIPAVRRVYADSRHPAITDYSRATHSWLPSYVHPGWYGINVEDFPGMMLIEPAEDRQRTVGDRRHQPGDLFKLDVPPTVTAWRFKLRGTPDDVVELGPRIPTVNHEATHPLSGIDGEWNPDIKNNPWNCHFSVPGPGVYHVTIERMMGSTPSHSADVRIHLRDFLVVSIGDSAASGQGNPDVPGKPAGFDAGLNVWDVIVPISGLYKLTAEAYDWSKDRVMQNWPTIAASGHFSIDMDPSPVWLEPLAYRSLRGAHAIAARELERVDHGITVTYLGFGRTDAAIDHGLIGPRTSDGTSRDGWINDLGEVAEVASTLGSRHIDALLIQIGINDLGVSSTLTQLVKGDFNLHGGSRDATATREKVETRVIGRLDELEVKFKHLEAEIRNQHIDVGAVYLVEYPAGVFDDAHGHPQHGCEIFEGPKLNLSLRDAELVKWVVLELNKKLAATATKYADRGWRLVTGFGAESQGHGYCLPQTDGEGGFLDDLGKAEIAAGVPPSWFVTAGLSLALQGDTEGTIHPNQVGQLASAKLIAAAVQKGTIDPAIASTGAHIDPLAPNNSPASPARPASPTAASRTGERRGPETPEAGP